MIGVRWQAMAFGLAASLLGFQAHATIVTGTITGTVDFSKDSFYGSYMGCSQSCFSNGDKISGTFTYDTNTFAASTSQDPGTENFEGGPITYDVTVGSHKFQLSGSMQDDVLLIGNGNSSGEQYDNASYAGDSLFYVKAPYTIDGTDLFSDPMNLASVSFSGQAGSQLGIEYNYTGAGSPDGYLRFDVTTSVSNVPLPASAPMFGGALLGFAAVGLGLKRVRFAS